MRVALCLLCVLVACGDDGDTAVDSAVSTGDAVRGPDAGPVDFPTSPMLGQIEVLEVDTAFGPVGDAQAMFVTEPTTFRFVFYGNVAVAHWQVETMRIGSCRLLELKTAFCTDCLGICRDTEQCDPIPSSASVGALSFSGLTVPLSLDFNGYAYAAQGMVPGEAFTTDANVEVSAAGDDLSAFTVSSVGVAPLVADIVNYEITIVDGIDYALTWTPEDPTTRIRLTLNSNNMGHGNPYNSVIECDTTDSGALTVPHELIEAFPPAIRAEACAGSDCPQSRMTRYRRATVDVDGSQVALIVGNEIQFYLIH
jgi:hypothetical protein